MYRHFGKRLIDLFFSGTALLILSPVLAIVALAILLEDGKPILFCQPRVGYKERLFTVLKFRSMPVNSSNVPSSQATNISITKVGAWIRRTNIDELPQLVNIFCGQMSLVGPRPALKAQIELCNMRRDFGVFECKPGLTGLAQINAYDGMSDQEKADWDAKYCRNITLKNDALIVLRTFSYLLKPPPVY